MISVLRQLPRNSRINSPVNAPAITASRITPEMAARTNTDWSLSASILRSGGSGRADLRQLLIDAVDDVEGRGVAGLQHAHQHGALAVHAHDVGLRRIAVAHVRDVAHVDHRAVVRTDRQVVQILDLPRAGVQLDEIFEAADFLGARRQDQILRADRR